MLAVALGVQAAAAAPSLAPAPPAPAWPYEWTCFERHAGINMPTPLDVESRCRVRFPTLASALTGCRQRTPECAGVVEDHGLRCPMDDGERGQKENVDDDDLVLYELRSSVLMEAGAGFASWLRVACSPPSPPLLPPVAPRISTSQAWTWTLVVAVAAAAVAGGVSAVVAWRRAHEHADRAWRELQPHVL